MNARELPNLATFVEAAECASFTAAARKLGVSQAAVSQRIQQLEFVLGSPLFRRQSGRVQLTEAGRRLHEIARRILNLTNEAWEAVTTVPTIMSGELLLAASSVPGEHLLPPALALFRERHPSVQIRVTISDTDAVLHGLEHGQAHVGLVGGRGGNPQLEFRRFARDELALVVPATHPWSARTRITPAELLSQPLIQREPGSGTRRCLEQALDRAGIGGSRLNVVLEMGSNEAIKEAILAGLGVAVLSRHVVLAEVRSGQLRTLKINRLSLARDFFIVRDRRAHCRFKRICFCIS